MPTRQGTAAQQQAMMAAGWQQQQQQQQQQMAGQVRAPHMTHVLAVCPTHERLASPGHA
jgi:hypothetical protein